MAFSLNDRVQAALLSAGAITAQASMALEEWLPLTDGDPRTDLDQIVRIVESTSRLLAVYGERWRDLLSERGEQ